MDECSHACRNYTSVQSCVNTRATVEYVYVKLYCHSWDKFVNTHLSHSRV